MELYSLYSVVHGRYHIHLLKELCWDEIVKVGVLNPILKFGKLRSEKVEQWWRKA